jgi:hypothetical protein
MTGIVNATTATIGNVLNTVNTVATQASRTINTLASGLDMLDTYVGVQRQKQQDSTKIELHYYRKDLINNSALEMSRKEQMIASELSSNKVLAEMFETNLKELEALFQE